MNTASRLHASLMHVLRVAIAFACIAPVCAPALLAAQQPYQPYSYPAAPNGSTGDPYAQPQYTQPQYQQPQPQYAQPQYQQPQYAPQQQPYAQQPDAAPSPDQGLAQQAAPPQALSADQLEQMLAPIALYPDALLAQILTASTYPAQVAVADQWLQQMRAQGYNSPDQIAAGAAAQDSWDSSVKALTAFPDVLDLLDHNLQWTTDLGDAYYNQPQDVMQTVQVLRDRAQQAGNLENTPQEDVSSNQGYIDIAPPNPEQVYVPTYDPWDVYGPPIAPYPGFSFVGDLASFFNGAPIQYGLSFALGAFDRMPFGLLSWGLDWMGHSVLYNRSGYFTASASVRDWGLPRGGPRAYNGAYSNWRQNGRAPDGYDNSNRRFPTPQSTYQNSYQRGGAYNNRGPAQAYTRPAEPYAYRSPQQPAYNYTRPAQNYERTAPQNYAYHPQAYPNRPQTYSNPYYATRPQTFNRPSPSYSYMNRPAQSYTARPGYSYANPYSSYRAPQMDSRGYSNRSFQMARNQSGGFRGFSQKEPKYSAPKFQAPRSSGGGGHFSAPRAPAMSHSSGGGGRRR